MAKKPYEGSKKDMASDKKNAKKRGMSVADWESSAADDAMDAKKMATGGTVKGGGAATRGLKFTRT